MTETLAAVGQVRRRAVALLGLVFAAGLFGGIAMERYLIPSAAPGGPPWGRPGGGPGRPGFGLPGDTAILPPYLEQLGLDASQRAAALAIVQRVRPRMDSVTRTAMPAIGAIMEDARRELEAVLTPEQRARLPRGGGPPFLRGIAPRGPGA